jgi:hypothetical protein
VQWFAKEVFLNDHLDDLSKFKVQIKGAHATVFAQCFKKYYGLPLTAFDTKPTGGKDIFQ